VTGHEAGGGRTAEFRREERRQREREERESRGRSGERERGWFPKKETLKTEIPQNGNFPKISFRLPLTITS
jgi:hypothetical protein